MSKKGQHALHYRPLLGLLRQMREDAGLTQRALAAKLHQTHVWVHKSETIERRVDITEFIEWCIACRVDPVAAFRQLLKARGR